MPTATKSPPKSPRKPGSQSTGKTPHEPPHERGNETKADTAAPPDGVRAVTVRVPMADDPGPGYRPRHADFRLSAAEAEAVARLTTGLLREGAGAGGPPDELPNSGPKAIKWLLRQIAQTHEATDVDVGCGQGA